MTEHVSTTEHAMRQWRKGIIIGVVALVLLLLSPLVYTTVALYKAHQENQLTDVLVEYLPFPVASVGGEWLRYSHFKAGYSTAKTVVEHLSQDADFVDQIGTLPTPVELAQTELDRQIDQQLLNQLADEANITVSSSEIDEAFDQFVSSQTAGDLTTVENTLKELYGWNIDQFKQEVVRDVLLRDSLQTYLLDHDETGYAGPQKEKIEKIAQTVQANPDSFAETAIDQSDDGSAAAGGDLGWVKRGEMVSEFEEASFALTEPNQISPVVKTQFGYHLIQLVERKAATDTEEEQVHVRHILVKFSMDDYLQRQRTARGVQVFITPEDMPNL